MILPRLGRWNRHPGRFLMWYRIYWKGHKWTPFCRVIRRYRRWLGFWIWPSAKYLVFKVDSGWPKLVTDPYVVFRAKDVYTMAAIDAYVAELEKYHPDPAYVETWREICTDFLYWQMWHKEKMEVPD